MAKESVIPRQLRLDDTTILYDAALVAEPQNSFFEPGFWRAQGGLELAPAGRGSAFFFQYEEVFYVLRHYCRGGLVRFFSKDTYLWTALESTRAWREWHLLAEMRQRGLPVPRPWAARVQRHGLWYRADIIIERFSNVITLTAAAKDFMSVELWQAVGMCIRRFHDEGVYHADLNAHNILIGINGTEAGPVYVIDFDRGEFRSPDKVWQSANLDRLHRSLDKLTDNGSIKGFDAEAWQALLTGYASVLASSARH